MNSTRSQLTFATPAEDPGAFWDEMPAQPANPESVSVPSMEITPTNALFVNCTTSAEIDTLWANLRVGGVILMELGTYPFSEKFGWVLDEFGVSWQVNLNVLT